MIKYTNRHGKEIQVTVTNHARRRWIQRWGALHPEKDASDPDLVRLAEYFSKAVRIEPKGSHYKRRMKRRGGEDTLYFKYNDFVFIVQSAALITVELGGKNSRQLN